MIDSRWTTINRISLIAGETSLKISYFLSLHALVNLFYRLTIKNISLILSEIVFSTGLYWNCMVLCRWPNAGHVDQLK